MQHTAIWNFAPADAKRLPELLESFGCAAVVAPIDDVRFGKKASELICRNKAEPVTPTAACEPYSVLKLQPNRVIPMPRMC